jgi:YtfJ family uncharacterized protein
MKNIIIGFMLTAAWTWAVDLGSVPPKVTLSGKDGGIVDGPAWSSAMIKNKVTVLFYVDPDRKDDNNVLDKALQAKHFNRKKYRSIAIVNMEATWMPDAIIERKLSNKKKEFPDTLYVKDKNKVLVKKWGLEDDASDVLLFDKSGKLIYKKFGRLGHKEIAKVIKLIEGNL